MNLISYLYTEAKLIKSEAQSFLKLVSETQGLTVLTLVNSELLVCHFRLELKHLENVPLNS